MASLSYTPNGLTINTPEGNTYQFKSGFKFQAADALCVVFDSVRSIKMDPDDYDGVASVAELFIELEKAWCAVHGFGEMTADTLVAGLSRTVSQIAYGSKKIHPAYNYHTSGDIVNLMGREGKYLHLDASVLGVTMNDLKTWINASITQTQNSGAGSDDWGSQVVQSDATLNGDGTSGNPLAVAAPYVPPDGSETKIQNGVNTTVSGSGTIGDPYQIDASGGGGGDMLAATYDPNTVAGDAFDMDNMVEGATTKIMTDGERTKLAGIEAGADVTDAANVQAAGALMDSELADEAGIKAVTISTLQPKPSEGAFVDGDKTKLDGIESNADVTDEANVKAALDGAVLTDVGEPSATDSILIQDADDSDNLKSIAVSTLRNNRVSNLANCFTFVRDFSPADVTTLMHTPEDFLMLDDQTLAISFRNNTATTGSPLHTDTNTGGILIYNITDRLKPIVIGQYKDTEMTGAMQMRRLGKYLFCPSLRRGHIHVIDISDYRNPTKVSHYNMETNQSNLYIYKVDFHESGKFAYLNYRYSGAPYNSKIKVLDITNPAAITTVQTLDITGTNQWHYYPFSIGDHFYSLIYNDSSAPGVIKYYTINQTTGQLTAGSDITDAAFNGVHHYVVGRKVLVCNWNPGTISVFDLNSTTNKIELSYTHTLTDTGTKPSRIGWLYKNDINLVASANYNTNKVEITVFNKDFSGVLGSHLITNAGFDVVQSLFFVGNYLYVANRGNNSNIQIYHFDYNSFAVNRKDY